MTLENIKNSINNIRSAVDFLKDKKITDSSFNIRDFEQNKMNYYRNSLNANIELLDKYSSELKELMTIENLNSFDKALQAMKKAKTTDDLAEINSNLHKIAEIIAEIDIEEKPTIKTKNIPLEIRDDINTDIDEIKKCMENQCYRSAVILCGRILEIVLHRKYFEATNIDMLEKSPGMGLGKIIAKLRENNIQIDPALSQQIHLINQVRVFSVHKKQETFNPSKNQAEAIVLYTMDILDKMFG